MKRLLPGLLLLLPLGCTKRAPASDEKFDKQWAELVKNGAEPAFIESDLHGAGLLGEVRRAVEPRAHDQQIAVPSIFPGALPDGEVVRVIRQNFGGIKGCYALAEREGPSSGKAIVSFDIDAAGAVSSVNVDAPAFSTTHLGSCVSGQARAWSFPKAAQGPKHFSYPLVFAGG
jgi:hypothetical protein